MNLLDKAIGWLSPERGAARLRARRLIAAYEAARPTRTRKNNSDNSSGDSLLEWSLEELRGQARQLEQNHDFAFGILTSLINNVVGPRGIGVEFQPKNLKGEIHKDFARQLNDLYLEWSKRPESTRQLSWAKAQRLMALTWLRDGEALQRHLEGSIPGLNHQTKVAYSLELLEPDFLPVDLNDTSKRIVQGVEKSAWGEPIAYWLYDDHPGGNRHWRMKTRRYLASSIDHIKFVRRLHQTRGVSIFATVMNRVNDIKDYEESERVAARIAAAMVGFIKKGSPELYDKPEDEDDSGNRLLSIKPGMIYDDLQPGEDVGIIESNRPSGLMPPFLDAMHRMAACGTMASFSTISKNYNGTFSSQRQELVEQWVNYETLSCEFIEAIVEPPVRRFVRMATLGGALRVPSDVDRNTLLAVDFITPSMPWIDPQKEAKADQTLIEAVLTSPQKAIRRRGASPNDVLDQTQAWQQELRERTIQTSQTPSPTPEPNPQNEPSE